MVQKLLTASKSGHQLDQLVSHLFPPQRLSATVDVTGETPAVLPAGELSPCDVV